MIRQIMQRMKTRICSGPTVLFSSISPMLIVLAGGWVIVVSWAACLPAEASAQAGRRPYVPYQTLRM
jgi:hypothetical protein